MYWLLSGLLLIGLTGLATFSLVWLTFGKIAVMMKIWSLM